MIPLAVDSPLNTGGTVLSLGLKVHGLKTNKDSDHIFMTDSPGEVKTNRTNFALAMTRYG
jgi:hypothetical protein